MKRVIIVDDAIDLGRMLQDALRVTHPGISISVVPSAEEALLESTRFSFDLLVTDLRLPGMNGLELVRKIRLRLPDIKIIMMTALKPEDPLFRQKDEAAAEIFLRKPVTVTGFLEAVEQLIGAPVPEISPATGTGVSHPASEEPAEALLSEIASILPGEPAEPVREKMPKKTGPLSQPAEPDEDPEDSRLSAILIQLRGLCGALSVILLDDRGRPVAQAGDLGSISLEEQLALPVITSLRAGANISYLLGQSWNHSVQAYRGAELDLVLAPVGPYALIVALKTGRSTLRLALAFEETLTIQAELVSALEGLGLNLHTAVEGGAVEEMEERAAATRQPVTTRILSDDTETPLDQDQALVKIDELIHKKNTGQLKMEDPDAFWETATPGEGSTETSPGVLSFEQAQKLGLIPPASEE